MYRGVHSAAESVSSRCPENESTMNDNIVKHNRRYVDQQLNRSRKNRRQLSESHAPEAVVATCPSNGATVTSSCVTTSINDRSSRGDISQSHRALTKSQQMRSEKIAEISLACLQSLRNRSSTSSLVSEISATDLAELRHHHAVQFGKLLPRDHPANKPAPTGLRKTLSRKVGIQNLFRASSARPSQPDPYISSKHQRAKAVNGNSNEPKSDVQTLGASVSTNTDLSVGEEKTQHVVLLPRPTKRPVPQGRVLEVVQLNLQESILSQITHQAIERTQSEKSSVRGSTKGSIKGSITESIKESVKGSEKCESTDTDDELEPDMSDRELEIIRELMKRVRTALDDESYEVMSLPGSEHSKGEKRRILCDILLMLRRAFRDICNDFGRPYRPTRSPVTGQELKEEMDAYIVAQKDLNLSHTQLTVQQVLESLDVDKIKGD